MKRPVTLLFSMVFIQFCLAEPFLAIETGFNCNQCHVNPTGGGLRNSFGRSFSKSNLSTRRSASPPKNPGYVLDGLEFGIDARSSSRQTDNNDRDDNLSFVTDRVSVYLSAQLNDRLRLYIDEQIAPGGSINRESWALFSWSSAYLKAGRMILPYGIRLENDDVNIRRLSNINFNNPDIGIELGYMVNNWNLQLAVTNGAGGAPDSDDGKQVSLRTAYLTSKWRIGFSLNDNNTDNVDRTMYGLFAGLRTGPVSWLFEYDEIEDSLPLSPKDRQKLLFLEANWKLSQGHYLKFATEAQTRESDSFSDNLRYSLEYSWFPLDFSQVRLGVRTVRESENNPFINEKEIFLQLHLFL